MTTKDAALESAAREAVEALEGVIAVADRKTVEFDKAHAALAALKSAIARENTLTGNHIEGQFAIPIHK